MTAREKEARSWPSWLEPGPETCEFCLHSYHVEVGYHCVECDRPMCPICVVTVHETRTVVCTECGPEVVREP